jgi:prepilin-type N-terminal cleavage/methylation domain-containing protein/prepilin-type processing-associated H-X9-DG protein
MNQSGKKGFTLVELLVVISIIALLLSILMPSLSTVRKMGQGLVCATKMKNIGLAGQMYVSDYNRFFPTYIYITRCTWYDANPSYGASYFAGKYLPMGKVHGGGPTGLCTQGNILDCPANKQKLYHALGIYMDYGYSFDIGSMLTGNPRDKLPLKVIDIKRPGETVLFVEITGDNYFVSSSGGNDWKTYTSYAHNKKANFLFVDGHVSRLVKKNLTNRNFEP